MSPSLYLTLLIWIFFVNLVYFFKKNQLFVSQSLCSFSVCFIIFALIFIISFHVPILDLASPWTMVHLPGAIPLRKTDFPYFRSHQLSKAPQIIIVLWAPVPAVLEWFDLEREVEASVSLMTTMVLSYPYLLFPDLLWPLDCYFWHFIVMFHTEALL